MKDYRQVLRRIAALLILAVLYLPLTQCAAQRTENVNGPSQFTDEYTDVLPVDFVDQSLDGASVLFAFLWPALFELVYLKWKRPKRAYALFALEMALLTYSSLFVYRIASVGEHIRYGALVYVLGVAIYLVATISPALWRKRGYDEFGHA